MPARGAARPADQMDARRVALYLARAHDLAGRRADAIKIYERILDDYERESAAFRAQVGLVTPYRRVEGVR